MKSAGEVAAGVLARLGAQSGEPRAPRKGEPRPGVFDAEFFWRYAFMSRPELAARRQELMRVAAWLWKTGVNDVQAVEWLIREGLQVGVRNWFAFYPPRSERRRDALLRFHRRSATQQKDETQRWLQSRGK